MGKETGTEGGSRGGGGERGGKDATRRRNGQRGDAITSGGMAG